MKPIEYAGIDLTKALSFITVSTLIVMLFTATLVIPSIKKYKIRKIENRQAFLVLSKTQEQYGTELETYRQTVDKYRKSIDGLLTPWREEGFSGVAKKQFETLKIEPGSSYVENEHFLVREFNVTARLEKPGLFFGFLEGLSGYQNLIGLEFPIILRSDEKKNHLDAQFGLNVYELKDPELQKRHAP